MTAAVEHQQEVFICRQQAFFLLPENPGNGNRTRNMFFLIDQMGTRIDQGKTTLIALIDKLFYRTSLNNSIVAGLGPGRLACIVGFDVG